MPHSEVAPLWRDRDPLAWLLTPTGVEPFLDNHWEQRRLVLHRRDPDYYSELLTFSDVNDFMSRNDIRYPYLRLVKEGRELPLVDYADDFIYGTNVFPGLIDTDKVFHHYATGATLSFQIFQKCMEELSAFCNALEARAGFQTQVNIFVTPPNSKGFTAHYDDHSFFILQISGTKHWTLYGNPVELPHRDFRAATETPDDLKVVEEVTLCAGDLLYLPKGFYHEAHTSDDTSVHITLGIFPHMWLAVFEQLIRKAKQDVDFRRSAAELLRDQPDWTSVQSQFHALLEKLGRADARSLFGELTFDVASKQIVDGKDRLRDLSRLRELTPSTKVYRRQGVYCRATMTSKNIELRFYDKCLRLPLAARDAIDFLDTADAFCAEDLPVTMDVAGNLAIIRVLLREGLLTLQA